MSSAFNDCGSPTDIASRTGELASDVTGMMLKNAKGSSLVSDITSWRTVVR
jgi:hypothetical protein